MTLSEHACRSSTSITSNIYFNIQFTTSNYNYAQNECNVRLLQVQLKCWGLAHATCSQHSYKARGNWDLPTSFVQFKSYGHLTSSLCEVQVQLTFSVLARKPWWLLCNSHRACLRKRRPSEIVRCTCLSRKTFIKRTLVDHP